MLIIGSAHNFNEIATKFKQGCERILVSPLFISKNYKNSLGVIKFNLLKLSRKENLIPLGGIKVSNLNKLNLSSINASINQPGSLESVMLLKLNNRFPKRRKKIDNPIKINDDLMMIFFLRSHDKFEDVK